MGNINFNDLQLIILLKLCFFVFVILGIIGIYRRMKPVFFVILAGFLSALAYYFLVHGTQLPFWGLVGDEHFITAFYESMAHGRFWSDFAYASLPPFYPPLFFWLFGLIGKIFDWNGVQIMKFANLCVFAVFPAVFYYLQKLLWKDKKQDTPCAWGWAISAIALLVVADADSIILKQYEFVTAALAVFWSVALLYFIYNQKNSLKSILFFSVTGALLFVSFYFWFFLIAIGVAIFNLFAINRPTLKNYFYFAVIACLIIIFSAFYWLPLAISYGRFGAENWQLGFTHLDRVLTCLPNLLSIHGVLFVFSLAVMIFYRKNFYVRSLLALFTASFIWQLVGLFTIVFFAVPVQEDKGFMFWNSAIVALSVGWGLERIWFWLDKKYQPNWHKNAGILAIILSAPFFIFGVFTNNHEVLAVRQRAFLPNTQTRELVSYLQTEYPIINDKLILQSGIPVLSAFFPINNFIHFNQHASHPAANFSQRYYYLVDLSRVMTDSEFYDKIVQTPFGSIDLMVLFKNGDSYSLFFNVDDFPFGVKEKIINVPKNLISEEYFELKFENKDFVVFEVKNL